MRVCWQRAAFTQICTIRSLRDNAWMRLRACRKTGHYWIYHTECMENAYMDIDSMVKTGKAAW